MLGSAVDEHRLPKQPGWVPALSLALLAVTLGEMLDSSDLSFFPLKMGMVVSAAKSRYKDYNESLRIRTAYV